MIVKVKCKECGNEDLTFEYGKYEWFYCNKCDEMCEVDVIELSERSENHG